MLGVDWPTPRPDSRFVTYQGGLFGIQRRQAGGVGRRVLLAFGHWNGFYRTPQFFTQPIMAAFAVQRAVQPIQRVGQRHEARRHVGQGFRLLPGPGVEGLARGLGSLAWVARLRSSSRVRGLGLVCAARCTAGWRRARHHRPKRSNVVQARSRVLSCHSHRRLSSGAVITVGCRGCVHHQARVIRDLQRAGGQAGAFEVVFVVSTTPLPPLAVQRAGAGGTPGLRGLLGC